MYRAERDSGPFVDADIAEALYEALEELDSVERSDLTGVEWKKAIHFALVKSKNALAKATGES